jgi:hypothetical protein
LPIAWFEWRIGSQFERVEIGISRLMPQPVQVIEALIDSG